MRWDGKYLTLKILNGHFLLVEARLVLDRQGKLLKTAASYKLEAARLGAMPDGSSVCSTLVKEAFKPFAMKETVDEHKALQSLADCGESILQALEKDAPYARAVVCCETYKEV